MYWHEPTDNTPDGEGFWSVATYAETLAVLRDPETYSSVTGGERPFGGTLLQDLSIAGQVLNMMDDPRHSQIRRLVSSGLTPRMIRLCRGRSAGARPAAARLPSSRGSRSTSWCDVAAELPMQMICILLGVPESERHWLFEAIEPQFDFGGSRKASVAQMSGRGGRVADVQLRSGADRVEAGPSRPTTCCRSSRTRRWTTDGSLRPSFRTSSCTCSSTCSSARVRRPRATPSRAGCWRWPSTPTSTPAASGSCAVAHRGRGDGALDVAVAVEAAHRHARRELGGCACRGRAEGADLGGLGQPRRRGVRRSRYLRHHPETQPALGFRPGYPLLPGR